MPTFYKRKGTANRAAWTEEALKNAMEAVSSGMGINRAARDYGTPKTTLINRIRNRNSTKSGNLGRLACLPHDAELKLVRHIVKLQKYGFSPDRESVRAMAFELAEKLQLKHPFNKTTRKAGYDWLKLFLSRHPNLSVRKAEGVSISRAEGLSKPIVGNFFQILENTLTEFSLFDKPSNIFNIDESGLQLINKPGKVIAQRGSKSVASITSGEKGETISLVACCNAEGVFLPPFCIFKGKNVKDSYKKGMPVGSAIAMNEKSAYINGPIFKLYLQQHFLPRKPAGRCLLILDGHTSHTSSIEVLELCESQEIVLLCLPSHTTHFLQPLDRSFFKSLKSHYYAECNRFMKNNPGKKITRYDFGQILGDSWIKSATCQNASSGFIATGIMPFNPSAIPDYAYLTDTQAETTVEETNAVSGDSTSLTLREENRHASPIPGCSKEFCILPGIPRKSSHQLSALTCNESPLESRLSTSTTSDFNNEPQLPENTPGKLLDEISPVPVTNAAARIKKRGRQLASVLTSLENIDKQRIKEQKKAVRANKRRSTEKDGQKNKRIKQTQPQGKKKKANAFYEKDDDSDSISESEMVLQDDELSDEEWDNDVCVGCSESYSVTKRQDDWYQCVQCKRWSHKGCMTYCGIYPNVCDMCAKLGCKNNK